MGIEAGYRERIRRFSRNYQCDHPRKEMEASFMIDGNHSRNYKVVCLSETMSPLTHAKGTSGNVSLVNTEPAKTAKGIVHVPRISANAIRHRCVRAPGARWLIGEYGLAGKLTLPQLNFLFHGGSLTEGGGREDTRRIADFQRLFPWGRLLGGSLPDQILAGSLSVHVGTV